MFVVDLRKNKNIRIYFKTGRSTKRFVFFEFIYFTYLTTPPLGQDRTQGQFFSGV